jgi:hypothetical protein
MTRSQVVRVVGEGSGFGGVREMVLLDGKVRVAGPVSSAVMLEEEELVSEEEEVREKIPGDALVKWHVGGVEVWCKASRSVSLDLRDSGKVSEEFVVE